jgi:hypothetical protein
MIKANELVVGHIFMRKHGKGHTWTVIDERIVGIVFSKSLEYALNDFEPIPLTAETLKGCGFIARPGSGTLMLTIAYEDSDYPCTLQRTGDGVQICRSGIGAITAHIEYLHQLQNLFFALTGQELNYNPHGATQNQ